MAQLPYTFTICPDGPEPTRFTASCPEMVVALMGGDDLTITNSKKQGDKHEQRTTR